MAVLSRRLLMAGLGGTVLGAADARRARAAGDGHAITVGCWGGGFAEALREAADARVLANGGLHVTQVAGSEQARVAALARGGTTRPGGADPFDVVLLSSLDAYRLSLRQLFVPVTTAGVASLPRISPGLRIPYGVPQSRTALTIVYDRGRTDREPSSFAALFATATHGRVGFSNELALYNLAAAAIAQHGRVASLQAAKKTFLALKRAGTLRLYPDNDSLGAALKSGEISMAPMWRSRAFLWRQESDSLRDVVPAEGAVPFEIVACVPQTSASRQAAMLYLETLLQPPVQLAFAKRRGLLPTVEGVELGARLRGGIGFTAEEQRRFRPLSLDAAAQEGVSLLQFWEHDLAAG